MEHKVCFSLLVLCGLYSVLPTQGHITQPKIPLNPLPPFIQPVPHISPHPKGPVHPIRPGKPDQCEREHPACSCNCNYGAPQHHPKEHHPKCEWKMVFKAVKGQGDTVLQDFLSGGNIYGGDAEAMQILSNKPYRDAKILDYWKQSHVSEVKIELFDDGIRKSWFFFDAHYSELHTWMTKERLFYSSYGDIKVGSFDKFSMEGDPSYPVDFVIMSVYNTCNTDCGFLAVHDGGASSAPCSYADAEARPFFTYSRKSSSCSLSNTADTGIADRFVISVKMCEEAEHEHMYGR